MTFLPEPAEGTRCSEAVRGHYIEERRDRMFPGPSWGYCYFCQKICHFLKYTEGGITVWTWTEYHYPVVEWP